jgi:hypothetical protein
MTHWKKNFDYRFTGAYELQPNERKTVKIKSTSTEKVKDLQGKETDCFVAYFYGENQKPMVLNKTNCKTIEKLYGPDIENWAGKEIVITSQKVKAFGDVVDALRVVPIKPTGNIDNEIAAELVQLQSCSTLEELQKVYTGLKHKANNIIINKKDELKTTLK